jgi:hypothetical protein
LLLSTSSILKHINRSQQHIRSFHATKTWCLRFFVTTFFYTLNNLPLPATAKMQYTATISYLLYAASIAMAAPVEVEKRQFSLGGGGSTRNDIVDGKCAPVTFIFARGSTEPGVWLS